MNVGSDEKHLDSDYLERRVLGHSLVLGEKPSPRWKELVRRGWQMRHLALELKRSSGTRLRCRADSEKAVIAASSSTLAADGWVSILEGNWKGAVVCCIDVGIDCRGKLVHTLGVK